MGNSALCIEVDAGCRGIGIQAVGERRAAAVTSRMERSTKIRRVTVPDSPWTVPAGAVTCGACSFSTRVQSCDRDHQAAVVARAPLVRPIERLYCYLLVKASGRERIV